LLGLKEQWFYRRSILCPKSFRSVHPCSISTEVFKKVILLYYFLRDISISFR